jgi:uncharacterized sulfatase
MHATLGMIAGIDDQVGRLLDTLQATGQSENTLVIFTSDHGEYHGHHGFWGKGLPAYEDAQRVPFLIWGPSLKVKPQQTSALASLIDLPPTILDFAGVEPPAGIQGVSLRPLLAARQESVREAVLIELRAVTHFSQHTFITPNEKLVIYEQLDRGELYDLKNDPDQYTNLWNHLDWQTRKADLLFQLSQFHQKNEGARLPRTSFA